MQELKKTIDGIYAQVNNPDLKLTKAAEIIFDLINTRFKDINSFFEKNLIPGVFGTDKEENEGPYMFCEELNFGAEVETITIDKLNGPKIKIFEPYIMFENFTDNNYQIRNFNKSNHAKKQLELLAQRLEITYHPFFDFSFLVSDYTFPELKGILEDKYSDKINDIFGPESKDSINKTLITTVESLKELVDIYLNTDIDIILNGLKKVHKELKVGYIFAETEIKTKHSNGGRSKDIFYKYIKDGKNMNYKISIHSESYEFQSYVKLYIVDQQNGLNVIRTLSPKKDYNIDISYSNNYKESVFDYIIQDTIDFIAKLNK